MKKVCLIYANCQNKLVAQYLNKSSDFNQEYLIHRFPVHHLIEKESTIPQELLQQADLFIYQPVKKIHGDRSSEFILSQLPSSCQKISFPSLYFKGYFPQYCKNPANKVIKPNYPYGIMPHGDSNIISLVNEGKSVTEIIKILSDPNFYSRDFVIKNFNSTINELAKRETTIDIKVSDFIKLHYQNYYLFHTQNHPSDLLGSYIANQILELINLPILTQNLLEESFDREVLDSIQIPIYPSVIKHLDLKFANRHTVYRNSSFSTSKMTFARYIAEYIKLSSPSQEQAIEIYFDSIALTKQAKFERAIDKLKKSIELDSSNATYYDDLGKIFLKQNKWDSAIKVYQKAIDLSPDWEQFYESLGEALIEQNKLNDALKLYKISLAQNANNAKIHRLIGNVLMKQKKIDKAAIFYRKSICLDPTNAFGYRCLGDALKKKKRFKLAASNYQKAIALSPKTVYLYTNLSDILVKQNKFEEAIDLCDRAIDLNPKQKNKIIHKLNKIIEAKRKLSS